MNSAPDANVAAMVNNLMLHLEAIDLCLKNQFIVPTLILIYSGIDSVAWLGLPPDKDDVGRKNFIDWADNYMECEQKLGVRGIDLYAARCGVLHTHTADSRLSREQSATRIFYANGDRDPDEANAINRQLGLSEVVIKIEDLFGAFSHGLNRFGEAVTANKELEASVLSRCGKGFGKYAEYPGSQNLLP